MQVTGASCPPLLQSKSNGNSKCEAINDFALQAFRRYAPIRLSCTQLGCR